MFFLAALVLAAEASLGLIFFSPSLAAQASQRLTLGFAGFADACADLDPAPPFPASRGVFGWPPLKVGGSTITPDRLGGLFNLGGVFDYTPFPFFISQLIVFSKAPRVGVCGLRSSQKTWPRVDCVGRVCRSSL